MGYAAVTSLLEGRGNRVIASRDGSMVNLDMEEALEMTKDFPMDRYKILETLSSVDN